MLTYTRNRSGTQDILNHLTACDRTFFPPLSTRTDLRMYANRLQTTSVRFEAWRETILVGLVAAYCNAPDRAVAFISNVSVLPDQTGQGIAGQLMSNCIAHTAGLEFAQIELEVSVDAHAALRLYERLGFTPVSPSPNDARTLRLDLATS